jgi:hypothetical protein
MKNNKFVVITSINAPTDAVREFAKWHGWTTIVVGDRKSPKKWECDTVVYLSLEDQVSQFPEFSKFLPENTYLRKMIGYLYAFRNGAQAIFESDDDNIPYPGAVEQVESDLAGKRDVGPTVASSTGWANIYAEFGAPTCWPRGFPLHHILTSTKNLTRSESKGSPWGVMQYLADEDPDVDAVYRMTRTEPVFFARDRVMRLEEKTYCPFNSQATLWLPETFPLMFLPIGKTDRVTDILRGYMSLACLWKSGYTLAYSSPVVYQKRNFHNLFRDFEQELDLYKCGDGWSRSLLRVEGDSCEATFSSAINILAQEGTLSEINNTAYEIFASESKKVLG